MRQDACIAMRHREDDIVLDFFAGSGTTGHAVMAQNADDGGNRRYILVQLPEPLDPRTRPASCAEYLRQLGKPRNIAELTKERLRRAAEQDREENPMFAGDIGFRVFKLDSSNIRAWDPTATTSPKSLLDSIEHLKADRTEQDVLYELLLKLGLDLRVPIEAKTIAGKAVHSIGGGFPASSASPRKIAREDVEPWPRHRGLAPGAEPRRRDARCVFRDSAFADDVAKTNLAAILQQNGLANVRSL